MDAHYRGQSQARQEDPVGRGPTTTTSRPGQRPTSEVERPSRTSSSIGPTACGKTLLAPDPRPDASNVPFAIADATASTSGHVGEDVEHLPSSSRRPTTTSKRPRPGSSTSTRSTRWPQEREPVDHPGRTGEGAAGTAEDLEARRRRCRPRPSGRPPPGVIQHDTTDVLSLWWRLRRHREDHRVPGRPQGRGLRCRRAWNEEKDLGSIYGDVLPEVILKFG